MFQKNTASKILSCAAVLVAITIPCLIFGRALIGVTLGLAFLMILISGEHKNTLTAIKNASSSHLNKLLFITLVASAINIPFSLRIDLSLEAWARTWLLLAAITFVCFSLKDKLDLILKVLAISFLIVLLAYLFSDTTYLRSNKLLINGLLLILPVVLYQCLKDQKPLWIGLGLINFLLFTYCALEKSSKSSVAGIAIIIFASASLFSASRLSTKKTLLVSGSILLLIIIGLSSWLPEHLNTSSLENIESAVVPIWLVDLHRQFIWIFSFEFFQDSPWVGYGLNASNYHPSSEQLVTQYFEGRFNNLHSFERYLVLPAHPHNWILEMLLDGGLIATLPLTILIGFILFFSTRTYFHTKHPALLTFIVIHLAYWGTGLFNFSFWSAWWQASFYLTSMLMLMIYLKDNKTS